MKFEQRILRDLYESVKGLYPFTFFSRYKIEPDQISRFITKYSDSRIIEYDGTKITLTKEGRDIILKQQFVKKSENGKFSNIPSEFLEKKLEINEPYLPNIKTVSADILK